MGFTEIYIKLCEKAVEIQDRIIQFGDYFTYRKEWIVFSAKAEDLIGEYYQPQLWADKLGINFGKYKIWLPRQDQLQDMIWADWDADKKIELLKDIADSIPDICKTIKIMPSMEQIWLVTLMAEKYRKYWSPEKKEWIDE